MCSWEVERWKRNSRRCWENLFVLARGRQAFELKVLGREMGSRLFEEVECDAAEDLLVFEHLVHVEVSRHSFVDIALDSFFQPAGVDELEVVDAPDLCDCVRCQLFSGSAARLRPAHRGGHKGFGGC